MIILASIRTGDSDSRSVEDLGNQLKVSNYFKLMENNVTDVSFKIKIKSIVLFSNHCHNHCLNYNNNDSIISAIVS